VLHGTDDQVVPIDTSGRRTAKMAKHGTIKEFKGAPHALPTIYVDEVNQALLDFLQS
jgi:non-heme chloroperoxidase